MFNTLGSFSVVYFALAAILFVLVLFEKQFIQLEEKYSVKQKKAKKSKNHSTTSNFKHKSNHKAVYVCSQKRADCRRTPGTAA